MAQTPLDDQGQPNDPTINLRANACYSGGSLASTCTTPAQWQCGWFLIRFEAHLLSWDAFPSTCSILLEDPQHPEQQVAVLKQSQIYSPSDTTSSTHTDDSSSEIDPTPDGSGSGSGSYESCGWYWTVTSLPELAQRVQDNIEAAGFHDVSVSATLYGEECYDMNTHTVIRETMMNTIFTITATPNESGEASDQRQKIRGAVDTIPRADIPGAMMYEVRMTLR